jgi:hypothetical protein
MEHSKCLGWLTSYQRKLLLFQAIDLPCSAVGELDAWLDRLAILVYCFLDAEGGEHCHHHHPDTVVGEEPPNANPISLVRTVSGSLRS